ncbi:MAG: lipid kinase YegS [Blastopirellula sp.]|nr:MAG: lipid kinase YegS [Blastopirellula sp.]
MSNEPERRMRLIVNGKSAGDPALRAAVTQMRNQGFPLEIRITWEGGDAARYAIEAMEDDVDVVIAAGGDGTINEIVNGIMRTDSDPTIAVGVVPYGTANDFATGCGIPKGDPLAALQIVAENAAVPIDVGKVNNQYFINVASGGFGAEVTAATPPQLKKAIGGAAYSIMGIITAAKMSPYHGKLITDEGEEEVEMIVGAVGNGRFAGGGFAVCPHALLDDGLLDVMAIRDVSLLEIGTLVDELMNANVDDKKFISYRQLSSFEIHTDRPLQLNLDGEPVKNTHYKFETLHKKLRFVLPPGAPLQENTGD